jgi:hypothetical protein
MCGTVSEFVQQYFKGDTNLEVWAIRFEFIADLEVLGLGSSAVVGLYSDSQSQTNSSLTIPSPTGSIHQASLSQLGVYSGSDNEANSNPPNPLPTESIHQALSHENSIIAGARATSQVHQSNELAVTQDGTAGSKGQGAKKIRIAGTGRLTS